MSDQIMDQKTAAEWLGCQPSTLAKWRVVGGGPQYFKLGSLVRYAKEDLQAYVDDRKIQSTSEGAHRRSLSRKVREFADP